MAYDRAHYYLTWGGSLVGGTEQWQTGIRVAPLAVTPAADLVDALEAYVSLADIYADVAAVIAGPAPVQFDASVKLLWAKLAVIGTDGKYQGDAKIHEDITAGSQNGATVIPPQLSLCVSLWGGSNFGGAQRGRMYWPCPNTQAFVQPSDGRLTAQQAADVRTRIRTMLLAIEGEVSTWVVQSQLAIMSSLGTGATRPISHVAVGRVVDTQRSRRRNLDEAHEYVTL